EDRRPVRRASARRHIHLDHRGPRLRSAGEDRRSRRRRPSHLSLRPPTFDAMRKGDRLVSMPRQTPRSTTPTRISAFAAGVGTGPAGQPRLKLFGAFALLALIAGCPDEPPPKVVPLPPQEVARLVSIEGQVTLERAGAQSVPAAAGSLFENDALTTGQA